MEMSWSCMGVMAVVAVSGSVALLSVQMHKRLENEFMRRVEVELGGGREDPMPCKTTATYRKKVRFADDVLEPSSDNRNYRMISGANVNARSRRPVPNGRLPSPNVAS